MSSDDSYHPFWHNRGSYDLNSKIMLTAIVSLALVIVFVMILHVYARCALRRQARRRARTGELGHTAAQVNSGEPPKTGLDPSIIASLPMFVFKQQADANNEEGTTITECAVCLSMFKKAEMARLLPNCKHTFHAECIDKWLSTHSTCPICRAEAEPRVNPEAQEVVANCVPPTAPTLETAVSTSMMSSEGTSDGAAQSSAKVGGSGSRLSSFRRILSRERSSKYRGQEDGTEDLERQ